MNEQIIINVSPFETRIAIMEGKKVLEVLIERDKNRGLVGNIYLGKVQRVLLGMQAAFVEIGLDKAAFLYVGDVIPEGTIRDSKGRKNEFLSPEEIKAKSRKNRISKQKSSETIEIPKEAQVESSPEKIVLKKYSGEFEGLEAEYQDSSSREHLFGKNDRPIIHSSFVQNKVKREELENIKEEIEVLNQQKNQLLHEKLKLKEENKTLKQERIKEIKLKKEQKNLQKIQQPNTIEESKKEESKKEESKKEESKKEESKKEESKKEESKKEESKKEESKKEESKKEENKKEESKKEESKKEESKKEESKKEKSKRKLPKITDLLKQGQTVCIQVAKDPIGTKGPRVTMGISLPGRHLVHLPNQNHIGLSRRLEKDDERKRLKNLLLEAQDKHGGGFVARTVANGLNSEQITEDANFLSNIWKNIQVRSKTLNSPALLQPELDLVLRCMRDMLTDQIQRVVVDDEETARQIQDFIGLRAPELAEKIEIYDKKQQIFQHFGIENQLARAMNRKVWLKSGGYLIIDQAEALTVVDVNTGRFVGKKTLEDTILKTNLEAVDEIADQLRLRNIGGIVIIDFIDMEELDHRQQVLTHLEKLLEKDRARCNVVKISELGLVEMTRQRTRESLGRQMTEGCWYCEGRGVLKSKQTVVYDIFRTLKQEGASFFEPILIVHCHPEIADVMYGAESAILESISQKIDKKIVVRPRGSFHQEQYDVFASSLESIPKKLRTAS